MEFKFPSPRSPILEGGGREMPSGSRIPEELYLDILTRLPVKSVLTSKCVCKSWFSIISNPDFVKLHLQQNKNNSSRSKLFLGIGDDLHYIGYDSLFSSTEIKEYSPVRLLYPFKFQIQCVRLFGSCNGLVFLWLYDYYDYDYDPDYDYDSDDSDYYCGVDTEDFLCVWNPATSEYKKIPQSPDIYLHYSICMNGVAYDGKNDDYKFVIGTCSDENVRSTYVAIFSLRSNSWETIETPYACTITYGEWRNGVLVNGDLHWLARGEYGICIIYLDFSNDGVSFKEIQLPAVPNLEFITVGVLEEGCLCVVARNRDPVGFDGVQVWEMKVYGVRESWTKLYVIASDTINKSIMVKESGWKTIWSFKNGKILFVDSRKLVLCDPKHGTVVEKNLNRLSYVTSEVNYVESLISLNSGTYVGTERIKESTEEEA